MSARNSTVAAMAVMGAAALALGGCASDGSLALTTGSLGGEQKVAETRVDPACVALMAKIDGLRQEGTPSRVAEVATGKTKTVNVKRESLAKLTELDQANAEFQARCSTLAPTTTAAASSAAPAPVVAAAAPTPASAQATVTTAKKTAKQTAVQATSEAAGQAATAAVGAVTGQ